MSVPDFDPKTLSVEERLALIDRLWLSIAKDAQQGDFNASAALDLKRPLEPKLSLSSISVSKPSSVTLPKASDGRT